MESKPGHPWSRRDLGFQCPGEAGSAGDMDIMRKESIVPPWPDQILIFVVPFVSFFTVSPALGVEVPSRSPVRSVLGREGGGGTRPLTGQGEDNDQSPAALTLAGGMAAVGKGAFGHPVLPKASTPSPNTDERADIGRDLLSCNPCQCPHCAMT